MRLFFILAAIVLALTVTSFSQTNDLALKRGKFAGDWKFDPVRTSVGPEDKDRNETLEISYTEPELRIVKTQTKSGGETKSVVNTFYTDEKGEVNQPFPFLPDTQEKTKTKWTDDVLFVQGRVGKAGKNGPKDFIIDSKRWYSLSDDGNTLTIKESFKWALLVSRKKTESTRIYTRTR